MKLKEKKIGTEEEILLPFRKLLLSEFRADEMGFRYPEYIRAEVFRMMWKKIKFNFNRNKKILVLYNFEIALHLLKIDPSSIDRVWFFTSCKAIHRFMEKNGFNSIKVKSSSLKSLQIVFKNLYYGSINLEKMSKQCNLLSSHFSWNTFRKKIFKIVCNL